MTLKGNQKIIKYPKKNGKHVKNILIIVVLIVVYLLRNIILKEKV
jgi:hypothetical protein